MPDTPQVTGRVTEAGRVTEVVVPEGHYYMRQLHRVVQAQVPQAQMFWTAELLSIRQPGGPDVVALAGETLRIAAGRVERVRSGDVVCEGCGDVVSEDDEDET